ncbi:MAG: hypothetical protein ACOYKN_17815, partial [Pirellula sp.]
MKTIVTDVAGDHDQKNQEVTSGDFGAPHCSYSCSIEYSNPIGPQLQRPLRSTIFIAAIQTAIEYEYRPPRRT